MGYPALLLLIATAAASQAAAPSAFNGKAPIRGAEPAMPLLGIAVAPGSFTPARGLTAVSLTIRAAQPCAAAQAARRLAAAAPGPALQSVFDRAFDNAANGAMTPPAPSGIDGWRYDPTIHGLRAGDKTRAPLASGAFKKVFVHPADPAYVVKVYHADFLGGLAALLSRVEARFAERLADARLGPRVVSTGVTAEGFPYHVVERIFGETLDELLSRDGFNPGNEILIRSLIQRMSSQSLFVGDLNSGNIMVGTVVSNSRPQAYVVDACWINRSRLAAFFADALAIPIAKLFLGRRISPFDFPWIH